MSYVMPNFKRKKDFRAAVVAGKVMRTFNPSGMFPTEQNGVDVVEGPHYPAQHQWYAQVEVRNGVVVRVIK